MILGDSIIKHVEGWRIGRNSNSRAQVKYFPGTRVIDCYDFFNPPLKNNPDEVIIHVGTNDLKECLQNTQRKALWT